MWNRLRKLARAVADAVPTVPHQRVKGMVRTTLPANRERATQRTARVSPKGLEDAGERGDPQQQHGGADLEGPDRGLVVLAPEDQGDRLRGRWR